MAKTYRITLTEEQAIVTQIALEEYFRLRMGQDYDFTSEMARMNVDLSQSNPNHDAIFDRYIQRRDHLHEIMSAVFRVAFEPSGYLQQKTDRMMEAETIWDAIRTARGCNRWEKAMQIGREPIPGIEVQEDGEA